MAFLYEYGLFLAKVVTFVVAIAVIIGLIAGAAASRVKSKKGQLQITDLTEEFSQQTSELQQQLLDKKAFKLWQKTSRKDAGEQQKRLFVLQFHGSMDAHETEALREEITAVLSVAGKDDEVLLKLESGGGVVHGYGLAASQLDRFRKHNIHLTVAIDKVAASGGYMMACIANRIIAAPFAIVGSIGVIAQLPNFNRLLKKHAVDFEQFTAGEFKRTVTLFGENTDKGRQKFQQELELTHQLFKHYVSEHRPALDIDAVATGEHWFGAQALALNLVDELITSDEFVMSRLTNYRIVQVKYQIKRALAEKVGIGSANIISRGWQLLVDKYRWH